MFAIFQNLKAIYENMFNPGSILMGLLEGGIVLYRQWIKNNYIGK
jgi:hypothetical protein